MPSAVRAHQVRRRLHLLAQQAALAGHAGQRRRCGCDAAAPARPQPRPPRRDILRRRAAQRLAHPSPLSGGRAAKDQGQIWGDAVCCGHSPRPAARGLRRLFSDETMSTTKALPLQGGFSLTSARVTRARLRAPARACVRRHARASAAEQTLQARTCSACAVHCQGLRVCPCMRRNMRLLAMRARSTA
jgi:hypothetical protein